MCCALSFHIHKKRSEEVLILRLHTIFMGGESESCFFAMEEVLWEGKMNEIRS